MLYLVYTFYSFLYGDRECLKTFALLTKLTIARARTEWFNSLTIVNVAIAALKVYAIDGVH